MEVHQQKELTQFFHRLRPLVAEQAVTLTNQIHLQQLADLAVVAQEVLPLQVLQRERLAHLAKVTLVVEVLDMVVLITLAVAEVARAQ